jgi:hypothetical protein
MAEVASRYYLRLLDVHVPVTVPVLHWLLTTQHPCDKQPCERRRAATSEVRVGPTVLPLSGVARDAEW